jgi:hypothetical protein
MVHAYWFKPKRIGYGAYPATWEGWAVTAAYCLIVWTCTVAVAAHRHSVSIIIASSIVAVVATIALVVVAVKKTDGR